MATHKVLSEPSRLTTKPNPKGAGELVVWRFDVEGLGAALLYKKEGNDPPKAGSTVDVDDHWEVQEGGQSYQRLKLVYQPQSNSGGKGGDSKNFDRRPEHPENAARMRHTSALSAAPAYIEQMLTIGVIEQPKDQAAYKQLVANVIAWIENSYPAVATPAPPASDVPADTEGLQPQPVKSDDDIPF